MYNKIQTWNRLPAGFQFNHWKAVFEILAGLTDELEILLANSADLLRDRFEMLTSVQPGFRVHSIEIRD